MTRQDTTPAGGLQWPVMLSLLLVSGARASHHKEHPMADDLPHWVGHYADMLGCDSYAAAVAVAIESLLAEWDRQRKAIGRLRGTNAALRTMIAPQEYEPR